MTDTTKPTAGESDPDLTLENWERVKANYDASLKQPSTTAVYFADFDVAKPSKWKRAHIPGGIEIQPSISRERPEGHREAAENFAREVWWNIAVTLSAIPWSDAPELPSKNTRAAVLFGSAGLSAPVQTASLTPCMRHTGASPCGLLSSILRSSPLRLQ